jgi:hypothetical protein
MPRPKSRGTKAHRRPMTLGEWVLGFGLGSGIAAASLLFGGPTMASSEVADRIANTAEVARAMARELATDKASVLGALMFYDPVQDLAGGVDGATYGPGDRAWVEAALGVYDLYRQIGGEPGQIRYLFRRDPDRVFVGIEGGAGHWHASIEEGQAGFLRLLARSSRALPETVRLSILRGVNRPLAPIAEEIVTILNEADKVLMIPAGGSRSLRIDEAWQAIGTQGLSVLTSPTGKGGVVATVRRAPGETHDAQSILVFREGRRFGASETIEVAVGNGIEAGPTDAPAAEATRIPGRLDIQDPAPLNDGIISSGETRRYTISIPSAGEYKFRSTGPSDVAGQLKGPDGTVVIRDDDGGAGYNFNLEATLEPGDYTLEVSHCCAGTGPFALTVSPK